MATEKRLIDANELLRIYKKWIPQLALPEDEGDKRGVETCIAVLEDAPTVDAVEVVHGYTLIADEPKKVLLDRKCGICDQLMLATDNYCPMCGAMNDGERITDLLFADMEEIIDATD